MCNLELFPEKLKLFLTDNLRKHRIKEVIPESHRLMIKFESFQAYRAVEIIDGKICKESFLSKKEKGEKRLAPKEEMGNRERISEYGCSLFTNLDALRKCFQFGKHSKKKIVEGYVSSEGGFVIFGKNSHVDWFLLKDYDPSINFMIVNE